MPQKPIDYANSSIYKLCCRDTDITDCYVGSTTNFRTRKSVHKNNFNNEKDKAYNYKVYQFIRDNGGWLNWDMILIEKVNVNDGNELHKEERKWIEQLNATLNCQLPTRTRKEWCEDNKDKLTEKSKEWCENNKDKIKEYRENNKDKIKEYNKEYYDKNKNKEYYKEYYDNNKNQLLEKMKGYRENNKEYYKEYRENNKEYTKEYYENNKNQLLEKMKEKVECPICNSIVNKNNLLRHQKSKKCINASK